MRLSDQAWASSMSSLPPLAQTPMSEMLHSSRSASTSATARAPVAPPSTLTTTSFRPLSQLQQRRPPPVSQLATTDAMARRPTSSSPSSGVVSPDSDSSAKGRKRQRKDDPKGKQKSSKPPALTATHELRLLRSQVAEMETNLQQLQAKWRSQIPSTDLLWGACKAAREKWTTSKVEQVNDQLKDQLLQQQIYFASLQSALLRAPLQSNCQEMFDTFHLPSHLRTDREERMGVLNERADEMLRDMPELMNRFTHDIPSNAPYSQTNITGGLDYTIVSNVFVSEIPHPSLKTVYQATLGYFWKLSKEMQKHLGFGFGIKVLENWGRFRQYATISYSNPGILDTTVNSTFTAQIVDGVGIIHTDFVDKDDLYPDTPGLCTRETVQAVTITPVKDAATGMDKMLLKRILIYRYHMLPQSEALLGDMKANSAVINGDMLMALICRNLQPDPPEPIPEPAPTSMSMFKTSTTTTSSSTNSE